MARICGICDKLNNDCMCLGVSSGSISGVILSVVNTTTLKNENTQQGVKYNQKKIHQDSTDRKNKPVFSGVLQYFPDAIMEIAAHSKRGNDKHNPGQPLHWTKEKSKDHADCVARHLIDIGPNWDEIDPETQSLHATALAWRALALLQTVLENKKGE